MNELEEAENTLNTGESESEDRLTMLNITEKLSSMPDVLEYIQGLEKLIVRHEKKIRKLQRRLKRKETKEIGVQTENDSPKKGLTEEITEAAQSAMIKSGFVYEETSGLYYDYNSGYYYNAEYGLYYDGNTGTYMSYDNEKQEYVFHSQVEPQKNKEECTQETFENHKRHKNQRKAQERKKIKKINQQQLKDEQQDVDLEEGECSDLSENQEDFSESDIENNDIDISTNYPPCIRIIIEETSIPSIKQGSLYIITYEGGTLGREGKHDILLSDINVSKHHLQFKFDQNEEKYFLTDLGSRNGTILNGKRMSASKQESDPMEIVHGAKLIIGGTTMTCHIHRGSQTCGLCEPGLIQKVDEGVNKGVGGGDKISMHKAELKKLKKKFAMGKSSGELAAGYTDRAQARRETVGSHNENEKTQSASLNQSISSENKGFKLLSKMGWSEGQSLGKDGTGRIDPVELISNPGTAGIGSFDHNIPINPKGEKSDIWLKTQERYQQIPENKDNDF
nr:angiogenic factor with G patch and FHA domains 1 [Onthophagus taurus]